METELHTPEKAVIVQTGDGQELHAFGNILSVLLRSEQTGGTIAVMSEQIPPGGGPPLHVHPREDEIFLVAEGRISYFTVGNWVEVGVGGVVYLPKGVAHSYLNIGDAPSRHWILTLPAGFERFFARCAEEFAKPEGFSQERIVEIHHTHGIELIDAIR